MPMPRPSAVRTTSSVSARIASADDHGRHLLAELGQRRRPQFGSDQKDALAAEVEQRLDHLGLAVRRGDGAEDHFVSGPIGGGDDVLDDLGVKTVADVDHDADDGVCAGRSSARRSG